MSAKAMKNLNIALTAQTPLRVCMVITYSLFMFGRSLALMSSANHYITCDEIGNRLNHRQVEVCKKNNIVMNSVKYGASMAVSECQHQFRHRRWNCTTVQFERSPVFGNSANLGEM